jgi:hypothetical protein
LLLLPLVWGTAVLAQAPDHPGARELDDAVRQAAGYLVRAHEQDGRFRYRINLDPTVEVPPAYNMLRHAGTMYALAAYYWHASEDRERDEVWQVLARAGRFLQDQVGRIPAGPGLVVVWSRPAVSDSVIAKAKLGGAGLGLIALAELERIEPGFNPPGTLEGLGRFILSMQREDGRYYSLYVPARGGIDDSWQSLYYPGEAALGLLTLHRLHPGEQWTRSAAAALQYLAVTRRGQDAVPPDHWALLATARLLELRPAGLEAAARQAIVGHAAQVCREMIRCQRRQDAHPQLVGCFEADGRTTPTATRLEGLLAALPVLSGDARFEPLADEISQACHQGVRFLLRSQIRTGAGRGGFPRAIAPLPASDPHFSPAFNRRVGEIRIDYVQHAMSALLQYRHHWHGVRSPAEAR